MIENHAGEGYIPALPVQLGEIHGMSKRGRYGDNWGEVHEEYITMWNNRFGRVPQMDRAWDLQPSLEYIQWHCEIGITQPLPDPHHAPEPEPVPETELYSRDSSYHPDLGGEEHFAGSYPLQYSAPFGPYPPSYSSHSCSSSSMAFDIYDFSSMFHTPQHMDEENVDHRNRLQRECRALQKYTLRTTPSNHQF
ncbi:hypothetical protein Gotur_027044 [Gossypium turneri]